MPNNARSTTKLLLCSLYHQNKTKVSEMNYVYLSSGFKQQKTSCTGHLATWHRYWRQVIYGRWSLTVRQHVCSNNANMNATALCCEETNITRHK